MGEEMYRVGGQKLSFDSMLQSTRFVVEGDHFDLWAKWSKDSTYPSVKEPLEKWEQVMMGRCITIGEFGGFPVVISIAWALINEQLVMFWEPTSMVVHHGMIEEWFKQNCWPMWDKGTRPARCNPANFHHAYEYCTREQSR